MIYLGLAIISSTCISILMRISRSYTDHQYPLLGMNYFVCLLLSMVYTNQFKFIWDGTVGLGIINGFFYLFSFILLQKSIHQNGVILSSTFQKLGIIVPTLVSILIFKEIPKFTQYIGLAISFVCILILQIQKGDMTVTDPILLLLLLVGSGCGDAMSKVFEKVGSNQYQNEFLLLTFLSAFILSILMILYTKEKISKMDILFGSIIGIPNYYSARFLLKALYSLPAIVVYPVYSVVTILLVSVCGLLIFKEKLKWKQAIAFGLILLSLVLLNYQ